MKVGFYLPEYQLTPQAIFENKILAFDVNFFNPMADRITTEVNISENFTYDDYDLEYEAILEEPDGTEERIDENSGKPSDEFNMFRTTPQSIVESWTKLKKREVSKTDVNMTYENGVEKKEFKVEDTYTKNEQGIYEGHYKTVQTYYFYLKDGGKITVNYYITYHNGWISPTEKKDGSVKQETKTSKEQSPARQLQPVVASWYKTLRNLALVALLSILVYIGIRITLSSVASDKAKYKQMLVDWVVALCLVFLMHYIMSFAVSMNEKFIKVISSISTNNLGTIDEYEKNATSTFTTEEAEGAELVKVDGDTSYDNSNDIDEQNVQLFRIVKGADKAYEVLIGKDDNAVNYSGNYSRYKNRFHEENGQKVLYWPAYDFMTQARLLGQGTAVDGVEDMETEADNEDQEAVVKAGYNIIYVVLVIFTVIFAFTYLKRLVYMAFLTIIAPLVAVTYPIDKLNDGSAQAFNMWLKEYIFNLLIQPMHLLLYTILVGSAMKFAAHNIFYVVVALGFMVPAEKLLRRFFGFEKAKTPGLFAGPAGAAIMMQGLNKLMRKPPPKGLNGGKDSEDEDEENSKISTYNNGADPLNELIGDGNFNVNINGQNGQNSQTQNTNTNGQPYHPNLTQNQLDELIAEGLGPGDQEYNMALQNYGLDPNWYNNGNANGTGNGTGSINSNNIVPQFRFNNNNLTPNINGPLTTKTNDPKRKKKLKRAIQRGLGSYREGMIRRYKLNKKKNGGIIKRGIRMATGVAAAGTLATAAGIIGITTGDPSKAAQYMAAGAIGGYSLGKTGVDKTVDKLEEQYKEPLKEAKIGYQGEKESKKKKHEKWKKEQFESNALNISRLQDIFNVDKDTAKQIAQDISKYTDWDGIDSFEDAVAIKQLIDDPELRLSEQEACAVGSLSKTTLGNQKASKMKRKERIDYQLDIKDRLMSRGLNEQQAEARTSVIFRGIEKFGNYRSSLNYKNSNQDSKEEE